MSNMVSTGRSVFIQYLLSPPRNIFGLTSRSNLQRLFPYDFYLKNTYSKHLAKTRHLVTISRYMQGVFQKEFNVTPRIIYPPVTIPPTKPKRSKGRYFLLISRLDRDKSIELAVEACNKLGEKLYIVGVANDPRYESYLRRIAGPTVRFLGFQSDGTVNGLYKEAKGFIFTPQREDFGLTPLESMAHGVPVIAYAGGGAKESVIEGKTGTFFHHFTSGSLMEILKIFNPLRYDVNILYAHAKKFSTYRFEKQMKSFISTAV